MECTDLVHIHSDLARVFDNIGGVLVVVPPLEVDEDLGGGDSAEGLSGLVTDNGVLVHVVEGLNQDWHRVKSEQLAEDEADLVPGTYNRSAFCDDLRSADTALT